MKAKRLKVSLVLCFVSIILMVLSLFGTWYLWEMKSEEGDDSREFTRQWKLNAARDTYEYRETVDDDIEVHSNAIVINYDKEEYSYRSGKWELENKFGTDYEETVKTFYLSFFIALIGSSLDIMTSGAPTPPAKYFRGTVSCVAGL